MFNTHWLEGKIFTVLTLLIFFLLKEVFAKVINSQVDGSAYGAAWIYYFL